MYWIKILKEWSKSTTNTERERRVWMKTNQYKWFPIHNMCEVCICSNLTLYLICSKEYTRKIATISWNFTSLSSSLFLTYIDAGRLYEAPEFISIFCGIHLAQTLVFCVMLCRPLFVLLYFFSFGHCNSCPSLNYDFDIFKLFFKVIPHIYTVYIWIYLK